MSKSSSFHGIAQYSQFFLTLFLCVTGLTFATDASAGFVGRSGNQFTLDGQIYRPIGYNQYRLTSIPGGYVCDGGYGAISDTQLNMRLNQMKNAGANVVRTWFFQSYWQGWATNHWAPFDRILNAAAARGMKVIPVLVNHYPDCEPPAGGAKNIGFYDYAYTQPNSFGYALSFRDYARTLAQHYANNQTMAFWQLVNEAETQYQGCPGNASQVLRTFADTMTGVLKAVDHNHLVSLGTIGEGQCGAQNAEYSYVHAGAVDMCEYHDYNHASQPIPGDAYNGLQVRINQCNALNKPIFIGEAGIVADVNPDGSSSGGINATTLNRRAQFFDAKITAELNAGVDGYLIWDKIVEDGASAYNLNSGRYGVGPGERTESATRGPGGQYGRIRSDWEDGALAGWSVAWHPELLGIANSASVGYTRLHSLQLILKPGAGYPAVYLGAGLADLTPGKTVTYHVFKPTGSPVGLKLFSRDNNWTQYFGLDLTLVPGWNTVTFTVPAQPLPLKGIGLQVNNGTGWAGAVYLDSVSWP